MTILDSTYPGFFIFGILAGLCPCNSVLCIALVGYVTGDRTAIRPIRDTLILTLPFGIGTVLVITPLGAVFAYLGKNFVVIDQHIAYALTGIIILIMALGFFGAYHFPVKKIFHQLRLPASFTPWGTFLLGVSFGAITIGRVAPMLFAVLAVAAVSGSVIYGLTISFLFAAGMMLPLVIISSIGGATGKAIRANVKDKGIWLDRLLGLVLIVTALYFLYLSFK